MPEAVSAAGRGLRLALVVIALAASSPAAHPATPMGSLVFDPTNLAENAAAAVNSARQIALQYEQLAAQYQQYSAMIRQLQSMQGVAEVALSQDSFASVADVHRAVRAYRQLGSSIEQTVRLYNERLDEARLLGVNWSGYMRLERERVARNQEGAAARVQIEQRAFERVEDDYRFARETAQKIPLTPGTHAAVQQSNAILNRLVTQNAEIIRTLAQAQGAAKAEEMLQQDARQAAGRAATQRLVQAQGRVAIDPAEAIDALRRTLRGAPGGTLPPGVAPRPGDAP
jgi:P-type conjugative transfer protein TrbJ